MTRKTIPAILFGLIALVSLPFTADASTIGNIASSQGGGGEVSVGVEYERVFNRDLSINSGDRTRNVNGAITTTSFPASGGSINDFKMESNRVLVKGTFGFHQDIDLDLFLKMGIADVLWKANHVVAAGTDRDLEFDGEADFAWGGGAKLGFYQFSSGLKIMGDIQYLTYTVSGNYSVNGLDRAFFETPSSYETKTNVEEWQGALYAQQFFGPIGPYLGVKYSDMNLENETSVSGRTSGVPYSYDETVNADADKNLGAFLGADINIVPRHLSVNVEVRLVDETACSIGVNYKF
ncbi:MAG: hypothetical protein M0R70_01555 [Nitrospirae bacterium]|nr:hypothetical protein [Nitrospirota bacterium]